MQKRLLLRILLLLPLFITLLFSCATGLGGRGQQLERNELPSYVPDYQNAVSSNGLSFSLPLGWHCKPTMEEFRYASGLLYELYWEGRKVGGIEKVLFDFRIDPEKAFTLLKNKLGQRIEFKNEYAGLRSEQMAYLLTGTDRENGNFSAACIYVGKRELYFFEINADIGVGSGRSNAIKSALSLKQSKPLSYRSHPAGISFQSTSPQLRWFDDTPNGVQLMHQYGDNTMLILVSRSVPGDPISESMTATVFDKREFLFNGLPVEGNLFRSPNTEMLHFFSEPDILFSVYGVNNKEELLRLEALTTYIDTEDFKRILNLNVLFTRGIQE